MPIGAAIAATTAATVVGSAISAKGAKDAAKTAAAGSDRAAELQNQQFEKMLALSMPSYNRANTAADFYMSALGLPGASSRAPTQGPLTASGAARPMTGGSPFQRLAGRAEPFGQFGASPLGGQTVGSPTFIQGGQSGQAAQDQVVSMVRNSPGYETQMQEGMTAIDRAAPLRGGMYSGRRMKALNEYGQRTFGSFYDTYLNRLGGMAGQAPQTAQAIGNMGMNNAANVGNLMMTSANARAQGQVGAANAWSSGINNAMQMGAYIYGAH